jgi:hypothetical protein
MEVYQDSLQRAVIAIQYLVTVYQSTGDHGGVLYFGHTSDIGRKDHADLLITYHNSVVQKEYSHFN